jgi:hypothetical protein
MRLGIFYVPGIPEEVLVEHSEHLAVDWSHWANAARAHYLSADETRQ